MGEQTSAERILTDQTISLGQAARMLTEVALANQRDEYLTVDEVADLLKVSNTWVRQRTKDLEHPLPHIRLAGTIRFRRADVDDWVQGSSTSVDYEDELGVSINHRRVQP